MFFRRLSPRARQRRLQKIVIGVLVAVLSLGLIGSSIMWSGFGDAQNSTEAPKTTAERIAILEDQAKKNPKEKDILLSLASQYSQLGQLDKASQTYEKALEIDPKDIAALQDLALLYYTQGKMDRAEEQLKKALEIEPNNPSVNYQYANLLAEKKDYSTAIVHMEKLLETEKQGPRAEEARKLIEGWKVEAGQ